MSKSEAVKLLGDELLSRNGDEVKVESCLSSSDLFIGLYFSAQWCPPCRAFTPELITFFTTLRNNSSAKFEIVFVSSDNEKTEFENCFREMPWLALPFDDKERKKTLARKYGVKTIPALVIIESETGNLVTPYGRELVSDDPQAQDFPWRPRSVPQVLSSTNYLCRRNNSDTVPFSTFRNHVKGIYFSANWCPPCKAFTPHLMNVYEKVRSSGKLFEVIFVSSDRSLDSFEMCFNSMPWLAIPYENEKLRKEFTMIFGVRGIPSLVLLDEENNLITNDGRFQVAADLEGKNFPWRPELVNELTENLGVVVNESPCLILFCDGDKNEMEACRNLLIPVAEEYSRHENCLNFFVGAESEVCESLRDFAQLEDAVPLLVIVDIPEGKCHVLEDDVEITSEVVKSFITRFHNGDLPARPLKM